MRTPILLAAGGALLVQIAACVHTAPTPARAYWISSDASQYSPTVAFRVRSTPDGDRLRVAIDSAVLTVPGEFAAPAPLAMTDIYLTAYIATLNVGPLALAIPDSARFSDRRGWRAIATSDSIPLVAQLRYGEHRSIHDLRLSLPLPRPTDSSAWLVFRISGRVVDRRLDYPPRGVPRVGPVGGTTRVYACSDRDLRGSLDTARSNGLRRAYGLVC